RIVALVEGILSAVNHRQARIHNAHGPSATALVAACISLLQLHTARTALSPYTTLFRSIVGHHRRAAAYVGCADTGQPGSNLRAVARKVTRVDSIHGEGSYGQFRIHNGHGPGATALVAAGISRRELDTGRTGLAAGIIQT